VLGLLYSGVVVYFVPIFVVHLFCAESIFDLNCFDKVAVGFSRFICMISFSDESDVEAQSTGT